jgi:hypothetical protein
MGINQEITNLTLAVAAWFGAVLGIAMGLNFYIALLFL